jgi:hypothetical protein
VEQCSFPSHFLCLQYSEIVCSKQTLFLERIRSHSEPNQGNKVGVTSIFGPETDRAPCELEHRHGGESNRWDKAQAFFYAQFNIITSVFPLNEHD